MGITQTCVILLSACHSCHLPVLIPDNFFPSHEEVVVLCGCQSEVDGVRAEDVRQSTLRYAMSHRRRHGLGERLPVLSLAGLRAPISCAATSRCVDVIIILLIASLIFFVLNRLIF